MTKLKEGSRRVVIRGPGSSRPALVYLFSASQGGLRSLKNGWIQSPKLPASARVSVLMLSTIPLDQEKSRPGQ